MQFIHFFTHQNSFEKTLSAIRLVVLVCAIALTFQLDNAYPMMFALSVYALSQLLKLWALTPLWRKTTGLLLDVGLLSYLIQSFDGVLSGWVSLLLLPALLGALTLPMRLALFVSLSSVASYALLLQLYMSNTQAHSHHMHTSMSEHLIGMLATFVVCVCLLTFFINRQMKIIREQQARIGELHDRQWRQRQIMSMATYNANTAHKLATPLANCKMLLEEVQDELNMQMPEADHPIAMAQTQLSKCESALEQMRQVANQNHAETKQINAAESWLQTAVQEWWTSHNEIALQISFQDALQSAQLKVDDNLKYALFNLFDNAADAALEADDLRVNVSARLVGQQLNIQVQDFGKGLSAQQVAELGKQAQASETGLGIGLLLSAETIEEFGGTLTFSGASQGTLVDVCLPIEPGSKV